MATVDLPPVDIKDPALYDESVLLADSIRKDRKRRREALSQLSASIDSDLEDGAEGILRTIKRVKLAQQIMSEELRTFDELKTIAEDLVWEVQELKDIHIRLTADHGAIERENSILIERNTALWHSVEAMQHRLDDSNQRIQSLVNERPHQRRDKQH